MLELKIVHRLVNDDLRELVNVKEFNHLCFTKHIPHGGFLNCHT
jgi:hypothetical protein